MTLSPAATIHLDTSFLIRALVPGSEESEMLRGWLISRRGIAMSTLAWGEIFDPLVDGAGAAARLFNQSGRRRGTFHDCIIAATAGGADAVLATMDRADFRRFMAHGLELAG